MTSTTLIATASNRIEAENPTTNYSAQNNFQVGEWNGGAGRDRSLLKFDLSSIPSNATILSATLRVYDQGLNYSDNIRIMSVYRVLRAWVAAQSTWNNYSTGNAWGTAGCGNTTTDRESSAIGSVSMPATEVAGYVDITLTASAIQTMITGGGFTNNGFLLQMATETNDMHQFSDETVSNQEPKLVIVYTLPDGGQPILFEGGGLALA